MYVALKYLILSWINVILITKGVFELVHKCSETYSHKLTKVFTIQWNRSRKKTKVKLSGMIREYKRGN